MYKVVKFKGKKKTGELIEGYSEISRSSDCESSTKRLMDNIKNNKFTCFVIEYWNEKVEIVNELDLEYGEYSEIK